MTMQPVVSTVVLKIGSTGLHCDGCMNRIRSKLFKIKGTYCTLELVNYDGLIEFTMHA